MKLGIIGGPNEESFKDAKQKGLEFLEFCINIGYDTKKFFNDIENIKSWIEEYNVKVASIGRWGTDRIDAKGKIIEEELEMSYKLIDAASQVGCENFVCGCNYIEELSYYENCTAAINYFSKLIEYGKTKNVKISTYNCRWNSFVYDPMAWTMIHGHLKDLGIKYDPSHSYYDNGDYLKEMKDWGERFYHVHIKGALIIDGERFDDPPAGMEQIDWGSFMSILYAKGYKDGLSIEPHSAIWKDELGDKGIKFTINYMNKLLFNNHS